MMPLDILSGLEQMDVDLLLAMNRWHTVWADEFMRLFSEKWVWVPLYMSLVYVVARNLRWKAAALCVAALALTIILTDQTCATFIRPWVCRLRPTNLQNPLSQLIVMVDGNRGGIYSFPSCHAANTWALAVFFIFLFRNAPLSWFMACWALVTCYSRSYMGLHYPGDLLAGGLVGTAIAFLCYRLFVRLASASVISTEGRIALSPRKEAKQLFLPVAVGLLTILSILIYSLVRPV
ncbi:MAG: phosphatase PAP2 family protein [Prevotellaceae bacterium]|nr:phosphatase PAP2 family protein [Prevotellaceae bacterium]